MIKEKIVEIAKHIPMNKYILTLFIATIWMLFFDENDILTRFKYDQKIHSLKTEISFYEKEIEQSQSKMIELQSNDRNIEKFAREQYLMKKTNEDIFIIEE